MQGLCAVVALAAVGAASLATRLDAASAARPAAPFEATVEATVAHIDRRPDRLSIDLRGVVPVPDEPLAHAPTQVRLRAAIEPGAAPPPLASALPGDRLRLRVRVRPLETRANPGRPDAARDFARRGIGAVATPVHPDLVVWMPHTDGLRPLRSFYALRARADARLQREGAGGALLAALALGERGGIDAATNDAFRHLGLTHLLSVSGLHLLLASMLVYRLMLSLLLRMPVPLDARRVSLGAALLAATAYAVLAGFDAPVRRSLVMLAALAVSFGIRRPVRRAAPMVLALLVIVLLEPAALFDAGAQMSFLATAALVLAWRPQPGPEGMLRRLRDSLDTGALATAATAPVAAAVIGVLSPWGIAANLVAVPWTGFALLPLALVAAATAGFSPDGVVAGHALRAASAAADASITGLIWIASHMPAAWEARPPGWAVAAALAMAILVLRTRRWLVRLAWTFSSLALLVLAPPSRIDPAPPRLVSFDVGQGDATLVQGRTASLLVDAGTALPGGADLGASVVVPALRALGVRRLDLVVATHADLDHRGGLPSVLARIEVGRLWLPPGAIEDPDFAAVVAAARERGVAIEERGAGDPAWQIGDLTIETPWPPRDPAHARSRNDASLVLRVCVAGRAVLIPGDIESDAEAALVASGVEIQADVVKLAHHGSRTSSTQGFLTAAGGSVAIVSAPRFGRFGMPHREVVTRADAAGYSLWWTGRDGAVFVALDPTLYVRGWRE